MTNYLRPRQIEKRKLYGLKDKLLDLCKFYGTLQHIEHFGEQTADLNSFDVIYQKIKNKLGLICAKLSSA